MKKRKKVEDLLLQVYEKGLHQKDCNLTHFYDKILTILSNEKTPNPTTIN